MGTPGGDGEPLYQCGACPPGVPVTRPLSASAFPQEADRVVPYQSSLFQYLAIVWHGKMGRADNAIMALSRGGRGIITWLCGHPISGLLSVRQ